MTSYPVRSYLLSSVTRMLMYCGAWLYRSMPRYRAVSTFFVLALGTLLAACSDIHADGSSRGDSLPMRSECIAGAILQSEGRFNESVKGEFIDYWQTRAPSRPSAAFAFPDQHHVYVQLRERCTERLEILRTVLDAMVSDRRISSYTTVNMPVRPGTKTIDVTGPHWR